MGPFDQAIAWSSQGIRGVSRFLQKIWNLKSQISNLKSKSKNPKLENLLHKTIKKITEDIENFHFNTAISALMILTNELEKEKKLRLTDYALLVTLLSPFAPHISEEIWHKLGNKKSIFLEQWPKYNPKKIKEETFELVVQINGKVRDRFNVPFGILQKDAQELTLARENVKKYTNAQQIKKIIFLPNKLINIVI
jgi:leucyl-tRNA synthetase